MGRNRGFKLRKKLLRLFTFNWLFRRKTHSNYRLLNPSPPPAIRLTGDDDVDYSKPNPLFNWGRSIRRRAKLLCFFKPHHHHRRQRHHRNRAYIQLGNEPDYNDGDRKTDKETRMVVDVPKDHLAVRVGKDEEETHKVVVPVIYLNHPLFAELLKEAEEEYGFSRPGQITFPCTLSKFETVRMSISAGVKCRRHQFHRSSSQRLCLPF